MKRVFAAIVTVLHAVVLSAPAASPGEVHWKHPAGLLTDETIGEVKEKLRTQAWARGVYARRKETLEPWVTASSEKLKVVFPKKRGNVYHNFSCPKDRSRLTFDPFTSDRFTCPTCGAVYPADTDAHIYTNAERYHGTMYDGWACMFYQRAGDVAADMGLIARVGGDAAEAYVRRGIEILMLFADTIEKLQTHFEKDRQMSVLLTYHREGDNKVLNDLADAYELLRGRMSPQQRERFERIVLRRMLDDIMLEPEYRYNHNNLYQWHRTVVEVGLCLERRDLIDWSFGYGDASPDRLPEHRSVRRLIATHFKPDGAFWEMCSGYHLYPLHAFCELAVISHNMVRMDPQGFPADRYDLTQRLSEGGKVIHRALEWFVSMAMPDRTMPTIGDSPAPRAGLEDYFNTAEVGYRYYGLKAVGDYEALRAGRRSWAALLYGSLQIVQSETPYTSAYLSSGWVSLRNDWRGNRVWVGLNALIPGGGHQHADRLTLLTYSHGKLLAREKATPYNESVTRVLGTLSPAHNSVTVDKTSQKQGESLTGKEVPTVAYFFAPLAVKFAELRGDHIYSQTSEYRRSVALIEDVIVDLFRVRGGGVHDWIVNHAGSAPRLSVAATKAAFDPMAWLANGSDHIRLAKTGTTWQAEWQVGDVTSRLTMMGADETDVYALETYPVDNAVITPKNPPCQTLCARRRSDAPFQAVWDAWRGSPNLRAVSRGSGSEGLMLRTTSNTYFLCLGPGQAHFENGVSLDTDAAFAMLRNRDALTYVGGTRAAVTAPEGKLRLTTDKPTSVAAEYGDGTVTIETAPDLQYDTYDGIDHYRPAPATTVEIQGKLWEIRKRQRRVAGRIE